MYQISIKSESKTPSYNQRTFMTEYIANNSIKLLKDDQEYTAMIGPGSLIIWNDKKDKDPSIKNEYTFSYHDLLGVELETEDASNMSVVFHHTIFESKCCGGHANDSRILVKESFTPKKGDSDDLNKLKEFKDKLMTALTKFIGAGIAEDDTSYVFSDKLEYKWQKRMMVFISPKSGTGKAQKFYNEAESTLNAAGFCLGAKTDLILTEYQGHAKDIIQKMDAAEFKTYYLFLLLGGDGMISEIINGFYNRDPTEVEEQNLK